jgi:hypothetical protein
VLKLSSEISITIDIDWAPDDLIITVLNKLDAHKIKATFFTTHETSVDFGRHEVALHPNYLDCKDWEEEITQLKKLFPDSKGVRAHSLFINSRLYPIYERIGIVYSSDYVIYGQQGIKPFYMTNNVWQIPIFFMDDLHMKISQERGINNIFSLECLNLTGKGLKVFDFHPIHIYLNTPSIDHYQESKSSYHDVEKLSNYVWEGEGICTLFNNLLSYISANGLQTFTLNEIYTEYLNLITSQS